VAKDAGGDPAHPALEVFGHVPHRLALSEAYALLVEVKGVTPKLVDRDIEGSPGAKRGLFEDKRPGRTPEVRAAVAPSL